MDTLIPSLIPDILKIVFSFLPGLPDNAYQTSFVELYNKSYWGTGKFSLLPINTDEEQEIFDNRDTFARFHGLTKFKEPSKRDLVAIGLYEKHSNYSYNHMFVRREGIGLDHMEFYECKDKSMVAIYSPYGKNNINPPKNWVKIFKLYNIGADTFYVHYRGHGKNIQFIDKNMFLAICNKNL